MFLKSLLVLFSILFGSKSAEPSRDVAPRSVAPAPAAPAAPVAVTLDQPAAPMIGAPLGAPSLLPAPIGIDPALLATVPAVAGRLDADQVVGRVQAFYKKTTHLIAKFRQTYTNKTFGTTTVSDGKVYIKKPGKMRWDYAGKKIKVEKSFITDGKMLWAVEHDNRQYFKKDIKQNLLPVAVTFLYGKGDLARDFTAKLDTSGTYGQKSDYVLELTPRQPSAQYKTLYLVVDPSNFRVKQSIVIEASGNTNHFRFYEPNTEKPVKDAWFVFNEKKFKGKYRLGNPPQQKKQP